MPAFSQQDFAIENNRFKLDMITLYRMGKRANGLLTTFRELSKDERLQYNIIMNAYINELPDDDWETVLTLDCSTAVSEQLFHNPDFKPEKVFVRPENTFFETFEPESN